MNNPVYVFDLDGVITNPQNSSVDTTVVLQMYSLLENGIHVVVNTGRSYNWVEQNLVRIFLEQQNNDIFTRFIAVCEKGGETVRWNDSSATVIPSEFALDTADYNLAKNVFITHKNELTTMFWDDTKRTMATIEKVPTANLDLFHEQQHSLVAELHKAFIDKDVKIDATTIATDIEKPAAGKYAGAKLIYQWIQEVAPNNAHSFISIGDSVSDYEMARYFADQHEQSTFVYVGKPSDSFEQHGDVTLIRPVRQFSEGTKEYLTSIKK